MIVKHVRFALLQLASASFKCKNPALSCNTRNISAFISSLPSGDHLFDCVNRQKSMDLMHTCTKQKRIVIRLQKVFFGDSCYSLQFYQDVQLLLLTTHSYCIQTANKAVIIIRINLYDRRQQTNFNVSLQRGKFSGNVTTDLYINKTVALSVVQAHAIISTKQVAEKVKNKHNFKKKCHIHKERERERERERGRVGEGGRYTE